MKFIISDSFFVKFPKKLGNDAKKSSYWSIIERFLLSLHRLLRISTIMVKIVFSLLPFFVCLNWLLIYGIEYRQADSIKRMHTWFLLAATVLYLCHAYYFLMGSNVPTEGLWILCSLSVYPLYYIYINELTSGRRAKSRLFFALLPAMVTATVVWCGMLSIGQMMHKVLLAMQVIWVCYFGIQKLHLFDQNLKEVYADPEEYSTYATSRLLVYFVLTSICTVFFDVIGRQFFQESDWLVIVPSLLFSSMLFALSYNGFKLKHAATQLSKELKYDAPEEQSPMSDNAIDIPEKKKLGASLDRLMQERKYYLQHDLKLSDLAREAGTCRTYLSSYLNQELGLSFSDYINRQRIEYAKFLIRISEEDYTAEQLSALSGFSSVISFTRNFKKYTEMSTEEWQKRCKEEKNDTKKIDT